MDSKQLPSAAQPASQPVGASNETQIWSVRKHMSNKDMYTGAQAVNTKEFPIYNVDKIKYMPIPYAEAAYKMFDEIIVNACDHCINTRKVHDIRMAFDEATGVFSVQNDGPGLPIKRMTIAHHKESFEVINAFDASAPRDPNYTYRDIYNPQILCYEPLSGTNLNKRAFHITGGVNGMGMKLVNFYSEWFRCETVGMLDGRQCLYVQDFKNCGSVVEPPIITPYNGAPYTKFSYRIAYNKVGYTEGYSPFVGGIFQCIILTRAMQVATYLESSGAKDVKVYFQNNLVPVQNIESMGRMFSCDAIEMQQVDNGPQKQTLTSQDTNFVGQTATIAPKMVRAPIYHTRLAGHQLVGTECYALPWDVCVGITRESGFVHMSIVNGMYMIDGGTNVDHIVAQIVTHATAQVKKLGGDITEKKLENKIKSNLFIIVCGSINHASTGAQTKNKINNPPSQYIGYTFSSKQLSDIYKLIEPYIVSSLLEDLAPPEKKRVTRGRVDYDGYVEAEYAGSVKHARECTLFIPEGNSARGQIEKIRNDEKFAYVCSSERSGLYDTRGVPINVRKSVKVVNNPRTGKREMIHSAQLTSNKRIEGLALALGLDYTKTYESDAEFATLRYGKVVICVDQDEDGKGNICSLLLNYFALFWPALIKRGFIQRLNTPLVRSYRKGIKLPVLYSFYSDSEFRAWRLTLKDSAGAPLTDADFEQQYHTKYYKGLATNSARDFENIFEHYNRNIITYIFDPYAPMMFEIYFGKKTADARKRELKMPEKIEIPPGTKEIPCSIHLRTDTRSFGQYHIGRSFPGMDGLTLSRRKVLATVLSIKNEVRKVVALGGRVISDMHYHHGDASLSATITAMGQEFLCTLPLLTPHGHFGSKKFNGNDKGSSRYIEVEVNSKLVNLLFPKADRHLLKLVYEEGKPCEPQYYVPIFPVVLAESRKTPGHGWLTELWARDVSDLFRCTFSAITNGQITPLRMSTLRWRGELRTIGDKLFSVGKYVYDQARNVIIISELPHGVSSNFFSTGRSKQTAEERAEMAANAKKKKRQKKPAKITEAKEADVIARFAAGEFKGTELHSAMLKENKSLAMKVAACTRPGVDHVNDKTTDKGVNIEIYLKPNAYAQISAAADSNFDGITNYFYLRAAIHSHLNIIGYNGVMQEYKSYESIFLDWFVERRRLYNERYNRERTLMEAKLYYLEALQAYCIAEREGRVKIRERNLPTEECDRILEEHKFRRMNVTLLNKPGRTPTDQLMYLIFEDPKTVSYHYIHSMTNYEYHDSRMKKRVADIAALRAEIAEYCKPDPHFPGARAWLRELEQLANVVQRGLTEGWDYDQVKPSYA